MEDVEVHIEEEGAKPEHHTMESLGTDEVLLQDLLKEAAGRDPPQQWWGVGTYRFELVVEEAYQAWHASTRLFGLIGVTVCLVGLLIARGVQSVLQKRLADDNALFLINCVATFLLLLIPCSTFHLRSQPTQHSRFIRSMALFYYTIVNVIVASVLYNLFHVTDTTAYDKGAFVRLGLCGGVLTVFTPLGGQSFLQLPTWFTVLWMVIDTVIIERSPHLTTSNSGNHIPIWQLIVFLLLTTWLFVLEQNSRAAFVAQIKAKRFQMITEEQAKEKAHQEKQKLECEALTQVAEAETAVML